MACLICRSEGRPDVCGPCYRALQRCRLARQVELTASGRLPPLYSLFRYQDEVRLLLHQAKIRCVWRAMIAVERLFLLDPFIREAIGWADLIVAAPPSLWGRMRGRYDVAGYVGAGLAKTAGKPFRQPRGPRFWRWRKRAFASRLERQVQFRFRRTEKVMDGHLMGQNILLVDDVVTTGFTMAELTDYLPGNRLRLVAFAHVLNP